MTTRLFHISDVHFGVENRAALDEVARAIADERPEALVCTGDLTQRAKRSEYAAAAEWFASLGVPVVLEPGNHDMPYFNPWERFTDPFRRYNLLRAAVSGTFTSPDVVMVPLRTTVRAQTRIPWSDGVIKPAALAETLAQLAALKGDPRTIIITAHHPLLAPRDGEHNFTIGGDATFTALAAAGAHAILSGHVHMPFDDVRTRGGQAMRMIGAGTLSNRLRHGAPASWRVVTCERGGGISSELRLVGAAAAA